MVNAIRVGPNVTVELSEGDRILDKLRTDGEWEPHTLSAWAAMAKPGTVVVDVGCYSGIFSIAAAKLGAVPVGIEPMPNLCKMIEANAEKNGVRFRLIRAAATDHNGTVALHFNNVKNTAGASIERKSGNELLASAMKIDDLALKNVSAIKIDVERSELRVLRGALKTLFRERPKLIVEVLSDDARREVEEYLGVCYRSLALLDSRNLILVPR